MKLDFEQLFGQAIGSMLDHAGGCLDIVLSDMGITDEKTIKAIKEWYGWEETPDGTEYPDDDPELQAEYQLYVEQWKKDHSGPEYAGMEPVCFNEWYDNEYQEQDEEDNNDTPEYNAAHAQEWMEKHPYGWYNNENDYGEEEVK